MIELSVIIPTYNRSERLHSCLAALACQSQPAPDFEVIVVVDGATDGTRQMLDGLETPYRLRVHVQANQGQQIARNIGAGLAAGRFLLFLDDDIVASERLIEEHLRLLRSHERVAGIGQIILKIPPNSDWFVSCYANGWKQHFEVLNRGERLPTWEDCYSGNLSIGRADFWAVGGFAPDLRRNEDVELGFRLVNAGVSLTYLAEATGTQDERKGTAALTDDFERAGADWVALSERHPAMLPALLGGFDAGSRKEVLLRRVLLSLRFSPWLLGLLGRLIGCPVRRDRCFVFLRKYSYWRGVRRSVDRDRWKRLTSGTCILMYHAVGGEHEHPSRYVVPKRRFMQQMTLLRWLGYRVLSLDEFLDHHQNFRLPPGRSVVITFDDGYLDNRTHALPVLRGFGFPVTIFLVSSAVNGTNGWDKEGELKGRPLLSWTDVAEMQQEAVRFGAHTATHPMLTELPDTSAHEEIRRSRRDLESRLGCRIRVFAYPFGEHNPAVRDMVAEVGFDAACGIEMGPNTPSTPLYDLRRIEVFGTDSLREFLRKLRIGSRRAGVHRRRRHPAAGAA